ncbi:MULTISPECIES: hypothetical protein [Methylosinus]|uniref:Uncharacterized protein n=1 Tax=Methylosinus trichosporium (strain ATCC 35070 / NCIMB 11131 / UNIQEM 75 / OB3b) TaxID=595536 RepID=A0A2D2CYB0_METT3|nr:MULTISPECIES: hypothetical protein [Methylosinus]ATQ67730.1 hypothetical protein CQW49_07370 [Methylosinus trichosporium OB3b]OBS51162.1 hypothetical protein A8B73_17740 [Methylosinus sp. 3S-1]
MALVRWPSDLPQRVLWEGYSEQPADGRRFTATSVGPPKTAGLSSRTPKQVPCALILDYAGKARLERFEEIDTRGCRLPFLIPAQSYDGLPFCDAAGARLIDHLGNVFTASRNWLVIFAQGATPQYARRAHDWRVTFTLLVLP